MLSDLFRRKTISSILEHADETHPGGHKLKRNLSVRDLTAMGIAAIIGAGIFSTIGNAAYNGGPAVSVLFIFTAIACGFSALCYAQFASSIPISGSAYTYAYASFGELIAWIIGWDLIMEYAIGNIAVAISWSEYFTTFISGFGIHVPQYLGMDYLSAMRGFEQATGPAARAVPLESMSLQVQQAFEAWTTAPVLGGVRIIFDLPAFGIVLLITSLVFIGIYESKVASNLMVLLKVVILIVFIAVGSFYVNPENWHPFAPNGLGGVLKGIAGVFFAYIGFDAISTTAEESKNPQRDLPRAMIGSLIITTILYIIISIVLTGMVNYKDLGVADPLAYAFEQLHMTRFSGIIAFSAIIAMASVLLVFQIGQPRIWMSMSRDGLLPPIFSRIHPKFKTPWFATLITGLLVSIPCLFMNLTEVTDLTSIGTLFAFVLVSGGVLLVPDPRIAQPGGKVFRVPFYDSRLWLPPILIGTLVVLLFFNLDGVRNFFFPENGLFSSWEVWKHKIPTFIFILVSFVINYLAIRKRLSLIPVLGVLTNLYLMSELGITNWLRFLLWLIIGLAIYFLYSRTHSKVRHINNSR